MKNFWLGHNTRRKVMRHIKLYICIAYSISPAQVSQTKFDERQLEQALDYTMSMVERLGYSRAIEEIEQIIDTVVSIDRNRFLRT